ncbi:MAG: hypothetical protein R3F02_18535 [Thiolinea sp.]
MEVLAPIAIEQREIPLKTSAMLIWLGNISAAGILSFAGAYHNQWELFAAGAVWGAAATMHALSKKPKAQDVTDCHVLAITSPNTLTVRKTAGGSPFTVRMRHTTTDGGSVLQEKAMQELAKILQSGIVEVNQITGNKSAGHEADITVRSIWPDKNGLHNHKDVAAMMLGKGLLIVDDAATASPKYLKALAKAKQEGRGLWGML